MIGFRAALCEHEIYSTKDPGTCRSTRPRVVGRCFCLLTGDDKLPFSTAPGD